MSLNSASSFAPQRRWRRASGRPNLSVRSRIEIDVRLRVRQHLAVRRELDIRRIRRLHRRLVVTAESADRLRPAREPPVLIVHLRAEAPRVAPLLLVHERRQVGVIQEALVVGRRACRAGPSQHAVDAAGEVRDEVAAELTARVRQPVRIAPRLRHHQQRDALHAGARHHHRPAADLPLALVHAVNVADAGRAVLVRHQHLADDAVGEHRDVAALLGRRDVHVRRVVLRDHIAAGHAVAAEVAGGPRLGRHRQRRLPHVDQRPRRPIARPSAGSRRCTSARTGGRKSPSGRSSRPSRLPHTPTSRSIVS